MKRNDKLRAWWNKKERDVHGYQPMGTGTTADIRYLICEVITPEFCKELDKRGYDLSTMRFEICPQIGNLKFASQRPEEPER